MLKPEEQMELVGLKKHGDSIRGLSRSTGRSRNTIGVICAEAIRRASESQRRNGRRSSIRSRLTSSVE